MTVGRAHPIARPQLFAYGLLGLPLAMAALPLYVHVPKFYGDTLGVDLAVVGFVLLALRLVDGLVDPLIGAWSDRLRDRSTAIKWSMPLLAAGMVALFAPLPETASGRAAWLACALAVVHAGYSLAAINHSAWGAEIARDSDERTRVTATREGLALVGVMVAAVIPGISLFATDGANGLRSLSWIFSMLLVGCGGWMLLRAPRVARATRATRATHATRATRHSPFMHTARAVFAVVEFRRLLVVYVISSVASAIPATLVLFFIDDIIVAPQYQGAFLATYFTAGALAMPLWIVIARRIGKARAWIAGMCAAVGVFAGALSLGAGDVAAFFAICAASGLALSADLALPPSLLADAIDRGPHSLGAGAYFGIWTMAAKLSLALAAGIALPLVASLGYRPGDTGGAGLAGLAIAYAGVPCVLKIFAAALAWRLLPSAPLTPGAPALSETIGRTQ